MAGKAYQIYRASTLGETLAESLTELERKYPMLTEEIKVLDPHTPLVCEW